MSRIRLLIALALAWITTIILGPLSETLTIPLTLGATASFSPLAAAITLIRFSLLPTPSRLAAIVTAVTTEWMVRSERLFASLEQAETAAHPVTSALIRLGF